MQNRTLLIVLPYVISLMLKLSSILWDKSIMISALRDLVYRVADRDQTLTLTGDQQEVIVEHISHASLKSTTVLTTFTSSLAAMVVLVDVRSGAWVTWSILILLLLGMCLLWWVYPREVYYFGMPGPFGAS